jgi:hypothetical protein
MTLLLLVWCQLYRVGDTWVERQAATLLHQAPLHPPTAIQGELLTINARGLVLLRQDQLLLWQDGELKPLPKLPGTGSWIFQHAPLLKAPALLSEQHLFLAVHSNWRTLPSLLHRGWTAPSYRGNGSYGQTLAPPLLAQQGESVLAYQPRSGEGWLADGAKMLPFTTNRHLFPVAVSGHWAWLGRDDGSLALSPLEQPGKVVRKLKIPHLSKSSLVHPTEDAIWFICFAQGVQAALGAWDSQTVELHISWLNRETLQTGTLRIPSAPLVFTLEASSSGSPKLQANPGFESLVSCGSEALFLGWETKGLLLQPGQPPQSFTRSAPIRALTRHAGRWYALHEEWQPLGPMGGG